MKKTIWILNHYARPNIYPGGTRHYDIAKQLVKEGYSVTIFASSFLHGKNVNVLNNKEKYRLEIYDQVKFFWLNTKPIYEGNGFKRFINMLSYLYLVLKYNKKLNEKPDIIIGSSVHLFAALAGVFLSKKYKSISITEIRDIWPQSLIEIGSISKYHPLVLLFSIIENYVYRNSYYVVTLLENSINYFERKGISKSKIIYIPNGVNVEEFLNNKNNNVSPYEFKKEKINFCYCGAHGKANNLLNIVNACYLLNKEGFNDLYNFYFIGDGPEKNTVMELSIKLELDNLIFLDPVPKKIIPSILSKADVLVFNLMKLSVLDNGLSPNKLFDYMCSGKYIISSCNKSVDLVEKARCGINVEPDNPEELSKAMKNAMNLTKEERERIGQNALEYVKKNHDISLLAKKFINLFESSNLE